MCNNLENWMHHSPNWPPAVRLWGKQRKSDCRLSRKQEIESQRNKSNLGEFQSGRTSRMHNRYINWWGWLGVAVGRRGIGCLVSILGGRRIAVLVRLSGRACPSGGCQVGTAVQLVGPTLTPYSALGCQGDNGSAFSSHPSWVPALARGN